ncbi:hypothetical protein AB0P04_40630, partial [Streptomyces anulatus]
PITPVTRRELHDFGLVLYGGAPASVLPPVTHGELTEFIVRDLKEFWRPLLDRPELWLRDIWVDAGLLTLARAAVTLRDGRLVTKRQALAVLGEMRAPAQVVDDIERRRYSSPAQAAQAAQADETDETDGPAWADKTARADETDEPAQTDEADGRWLALRANLTIAFLTSEIDAIIARCSAAPAPDSRP